jgi:ABC-type phosphate transport system auxiliary subunit
MMKPKLTAIAVTLLIMSTSAFAVGADISPQLQLLQDKIEQSQKYTLQQVTALQKQVSDNAVVQSTQLQAQVVQLNKDTVVAMQAQIKQSHDALQTQIDALQKQVQASVTMSTQNLQAYMEQSKKNNDLILAQIAKMRGDIQNLISTTPAPVVK